MNIQYTSHAVDRMMERGITPELVISTLLHGAESRQGLRTHTVLGKMHVITERGTRVWTVVTAFRLSKNSGFKRRVNKKCQQRRHEQRCWEAAHRDWNR